MEYWTRWQRRRTPNPVDEVRLVPTSQIAVYERGGWLGLPIGTQRVLILGMATLHVFTIAELKSIFAHEYGHFSNNDTAYSRIIGGVSVRLYRIMDNIRSQTEWWMVNPAYWLFWAYLLLYRLVAEAFSRQREFFADRLAAFAYGGSTFGSALEKYSIESALFEGAMQERMWEVRQRGRWFNNLYDTFREWRNDHITNSQIEDLRNQLLGDKGSLFASHPTIAERISRTSAINPDAPVYTGSALQIFETTKKIEEELSELQASVIQQALDEERKGHEEKTRQESRSNQAPLLRIILILVIVLTAFIVVKWASG
jgi:hypothetical protein